MNDHAIEKRNQKETENESIADQVDCGGETIQGEKEFHPRVGLFCIHFFRWGLLRPKILLIRHFSGCTFMCVRPSRAAFSQKHTLCARSLPAGAIRRMRAMADVASNAGAAFE